MLGGNTSNIVAFSSRAINSTAPVSMEPASFNQSGSNSSTIQNIAFGVVATALAITGVIITFLQYRHSRRTFSEASRTSTDLELSSTLDQNGGDAMEEVDVGLLSRKICTMVFILTHAQTISSPPLAN
jgi:hypothetical protein